MLKSFQKIFNKMPEMRYNALFLLALLCFVALAINYKLTEALQLLTLISLYCIIKDQNRKENFLDLALGLILVFTVYIIFRPNNLLIDYKNAFKILMAFVCGRALRVYLPKGFSYILSATGITLAISLLISYVNGFPASDLFINRLCLGYKFGPNQLGQVAMCSIIFFMTLKENLSKLFKIFMYLISIVCTGILVFSESRTAIIGLIICSLYWMFNFKRLKCGLAIVLVFIVLTGIFSVLPKATLERFKTASTFDDTAVGGRFIVWEMALNKAKQLNLWGNSNFSKLYLDYITKNKTELSKKYPISYNIPMIHSHNVYLGIIIKYGVVGALLALLFMLNILYKAIKYDDVFVKSILILFFIVGFSEDFMHFTYGIFILNFAAGSLTITTKAITEREIEQN